MMRKRNRDEEAEYERVGEEGNTKLRRRGKVHGTREFRL